MSIRYTYMLVTNDKYELPVAVNPSIRQLAQDMGLGYSNLYRALNEGRACINNKYKCIKIDLLAG